MFRYQDMVTRPEGEVFCLCGQPADFMALDESERVRFACAECARSHPGAYCPIERVEVVPDSRS